ncbi:hypothetical protein BOTBODRAFT_50812 [Botryobasidium botryosum FD-172 SS1]|uniref:RNase III domain-containing protein n=1 Tax=Botryobasidium botryosum (strain FD-172 SS1) TaxID=930990 RepID=A0A067N9F5_BOTB1|nr:hypothetical protein BOTBODRAFT_50812 [Botryobasidium botryosum FD-172 SS1]
MPVCASRDGLAALGSSRVLLAVSLLRPDNFWSLHPGSAGCSELHVAPLSSPPPLPSDTRPLPAMAHPAKRPRRSSVTENDPQNSKKRKVAQIPQPTTPSADAIARKKNKKEQAKPARQNRAAGSSKVLENQPINLALPNNNVAAPSATPESTPHTLFPSNSASPSLPDPRGSAQIGQEPNNTIPSHLKHVGETYAKRVPAFWRDSIQTSTPGVVYAHHISVADGFSHIIMTRAPPPDMEALAHLPRAVTVTSLGPCILNDKELKAVHAYTLSMCQAGIRDSKDRPKVNIPAHHAPYYLAPAVFESWDVDEDRAVWAVDLGKLNRVKELCSKVIKGDRQDLAYSIGYINSLLLAKELNATKLCDGNVDEHLLLQALTSARANPRWCLESLEFLGDAYLSFAWGIAEFFVRASVPSDIGLSNADLGRLAKKTDLLSYCSADQNTFARSTLPINYETQAGYGAPVKQLMGSKQPADHLEAVLGAILESQGRGAAFRALRTFGVQLPAPSILNQWSDLVVMISTEVQAPTISHGGRIESNRQLIEAHIGRSISNPLVFEEVTARCAPGHPNRVAYLSLGHHVYKYYMSEYFYDRYASLGPGILTELRSNILAPVSASALSVYTQVCRLAPTDPAVEKFIADVSNARAQVDEITDVEGLQPKQHWKVLSPPGTRLSNPIMAVFAAFLLSDDLDAAKIFVDTVVHAFLQEYAIPQVLHTVLLSRTRKAALALEASREGDTVIYQAVRGTQLFARGEGATLNSAARECCLAALRTLAEEHATKTAPWSGCRHIV